MREDTLSYKISQNNTRLEAIDINIEQSLKERKDLTQIELLSR